MADFLRRLFDGNERDIARYQQVVQRVNALESQVTGLSTADLRAKTDEFRQTVQAEWAEKLETLRTEDTPKSEMKDKSRAALDEVLDRILPEAFAVVREAARRTLGQRHYDVQLIGGMVTHDGRIGELRTGEGKTLMATLPLYLNALAGKGAHLVTANDYLSKVGAVWMGPIYDLLGMTVGIIQGQSPETGDEGGSYQFDATYEDLDPRFTYCRRISRREAYHCDVTYGTNNEFGFDYLRDNMAFSADELVQRELHYCIVDEVDSILVDEARTPLIISGFVDQDTSMYYTVNDVIRQLKRGKDANTQAERDDPTHDRNDPSMHYLVDEKQKTVSPTDSGISKIEMMTGIRNLADDPQMMHYVTAAMKAHALFKKDIDYVIKDGEIIIVDEFTGRLMFGRRYSDGLHQAIEAKEKVEIKHESQTLATITFQNLFRLYLKLAGMTGTAKTEEDEFRKIYGLDVVVVPTNRPMVRRDNPDIIYKNVEHKYRGIAAEILRLFAKQQPVLVGTRSIEMSELVSSRITYDRLQVLCMVSLIRMKLEASKTEKAKKEQWNAALNADLDTITLGKLNPLMREFNIPIDPLCDDSLAEIARMLDLPASEDVLNNLDEALRHGIPHNILNAKYHEKEAIIIAEAGRKGAITIATNMAGRGVDILLGGKQASPEDAEVVAPPREESVALPAASDDVAEGDDDEAPAEEILLSYRRGGKPSVLDSVAITAEEHSQAAQDVCSVGGLFILGTERHESRRIDNQLRGRSGRQGDPGESRFFVSLEDELWRLFGDRTQHPLLRTWPEDQAMDARILSRMIERAQKKVEQHHFEIRKHVLQYDDVMNKQREVIYGERRRILEGANLEQTIRGFLTEIVASSVTMFCPDASTGLDWDLDELYKGMDEFFPLSLYADRTALEGKSRDQLNDDLTTLIEQAYADKEQQVIEVTADPEGMRSLERHMALQVINRKWMEHLANMDYLREGINLRGYAQQDPLVVYQKEAFAMFDEMQHAIQDEIARLMFHVQFVQEEHKPRRQYGTFTNLGEGEGVPQVEGAGSGAPKAKKLGRNDPCWCGSKKKYKHCHYPD